MKKEENDKLSIFNDIDIMKIKEEDAREKLTKKLNNYFKSEKL